LIHRGVPFAPGDRPVVRSALYGEEFPPQRMVAEFEDTGKQTPVLVTSVPIRDPDGNLLGAMSTHQDITDIVEAERRKDEFLAIVGHELRSPLGQIEAIAKAIAERGEDLEAGLRGELLNDLGHSAARALNLVNNLLVLGRAEVGQSLAPEPLLVSRAVAAMAHELGEQQNRTVRVTSADDGLIASVASTVFERVAVNLIGNALKYSPTHTDVEVVVECDRDEAVVRVLDRGIGLSEDEVSQIFEPYHRSERAASYAAGVGVGLTVCMRLVKSQGGRIWAAPRPGGGAEFGFAFPRYRDDAGL
jgi:K+-sensing histidine kinase KdpD